jgi:hypothetical protein
MRRIMLTVVATIATMVAVPAAPGSAAAVVVDSVAGSPVGLEAEEPSVTLTIAAEPLSISQGGSSTITGVASVDGAPLASTVLTLSVSNDGTVFTPLLTRTTDSQGRVSAEVAPPGTTIYRWEYAGSPDRGSATSLRVVITVRRPTTLSIDASPATLSPGDSTTLSTVLRADGAPQAVRRVELYRSTDGGASWTFVAAPITDEAGRASQSVAPATTTTYQWRHPSTDSLEASASASRMVKVLSATALTMEADADTVPAGGSTTLRTELSVGGRPVHGDVTLWAVEDGGTTWSVVGEAETNLGGSASLVVSPTVATRYQWRFAETDDLRAARSPSTVVDIAEPTRATELAIEVGASRIYVGQKTTVRATLTAGGEPRMNRQVELSASTDGGLTWAPVATRTTDAIGQASAAVAPTETTRYRWRFAGAGNFTSSSSPTKTVTVLPLRTSTLTNAAAALTIDAGDRARLSTVLKVDGRALVGATVELQSAPLARGAWDPVARAVTDAGGAASVAVRQEVNRLYRWVYAGSPSDAEAVSPKLTVNARFVVSAVALASPGPGSSSLVVGGRVSRHTGVPVRLMKVTSTGPVELARATIRTDGTYRITVARLPAGSFRAFVEVGPDLFNAAGRSANIAVQVPG